MTRVQKSVSSTREDYIRLKDTYILNKEKLELAPSDMPVLHPLPRVDEISVDVDSDPRAAYFQQVQNGKICPYGTDFSPVRNHGPANRRKGSLMFQ